MGTGWDFLFGKQTASERIHGRCAYEHCSLHAMRCQRHCEAVRDATPALNSLRFNEDQSALRRPRFARRLDWHRRQSVYPGSILCAPRLIVSVGMLFVGAAAGTRLRAPVGSAERKRLPLNDCAAAQPRSRRDYLNSGATVVCRWELYRRSTCRVTSSYKCHRGAGSPGNLPPARSPRQTSAAEATLHLGHPTSDKAVTDP